MNSRLDNLTISTILHRHSLRDYKQASVPRDVLDAVLACGLSAPNAMNRQPWHITVVEDRVLMDEMNQATLVEAKKDAVYAAKISETYHAFYRAPVLLVISVKADDIWGAADAGLLVGNLTLAAGSLGLGSCVIGFLRFLFTGSQASAYLKRLQVPTDYQPMFGFILGYPAIHAESKTLRSLSLSAEQLDKITYL